MASSPGTHSSHSAYRIYCAHSNEDVEVFPCSVASRPSAEKLDNTSPERLDMTPSANNFDTRRWFKWFSDKVGCASSDNKNALPILIAALLLVVPFFFSHGPIGRMVFRFFGGFGIVFSIAAFYMTIKLPGGTESPGFGTSRSTSLFTAC